MSNRHSFGGRGGGNAGLGSGSVGRGVGVSWTGIRSTVSLENISTTNLNKLNTQPFNKFLFKQKWKITSKRSIKYSFKKSRIFWSSKR